MKLAILGFAIAALGLGALLLLGDGENGTQELEGVGFTVELPDEWSAQDVTFPLAEEANVDLGDDLRGIDEENWIVVYSFVREGETPVSEGNVMAFAPALRKRFEEISKAVPGATLAEEPYPVEAAGLPALRLRQTYEGASGTRNDFLLTELFGEGFGYVVGCNSTPAHADEVSDACDEALASFEENASAGVD